MRYRTYFVFALVLTFALRYAQAQDPFSRWQHFSATRTGGPIVRDPMKIYRLGNQFRADHDDQVHITNMENLSSISIANDKCLSIPLPDGPAYPFDAPAVYKDYKFERVQLEGEETVDGHKCKMEALTYTQKDSDSVFVKMKLWEAQDLDGFPIKIDVLPYIRKKPFTFHFSDVSMEAPDAALFKKPANCLKVSTAAADSTEKKGKTAKPAAKPADKPAQKPPQ